MSVQGESTDITIVAGADLRTSKLYKAVAVAGTIAEANDAAIGLLQNKPNTGEGAQVRTFGKMKGYAAAAITKGARVKVTTSGYLTAVASGDGACGKALEAANSGDLFTLFGVFGAAGTTI